MFNRSKLESLRDVSVTRIGDALSYGFPQTVLGSTSLYTRDQWVPSTFQGSLFESVHALRLVS